jgi:malate permease and related proteins
MNLLTSLSPVIPVFLLIGVGYVFAHWKKINLAALTEIIVYLAAPCLVFTSLAGRSLFAVDIAVICAGAIGMVGGVGLLIWVYFVLFRFRSRGFALPVLFMNAGNMGMPLALFALGEPGLQRATLMFVIMSIFQYSLGIYIVSGKGNWKEIFRLPLPYATALGLSFNVGQIVVPEPLFRPLAMLGYSTIPLMLVSLGYRLHDVRSLRWGHALGGALLRVCGGFVAAYTTVAIIGAQDINRQLILLYGSLPAAVVNFVLTEKYGQDPELAASIVVLSTMLSLCAIPMVLWLIL